MCGYKMKSTNNRQDEYSWKCLWVKKCGYEVYETSNGKLHWFKSKERGRKCLLGKTGVL